MKTENILREVVAKEIYSKLDLRQAFEVLLKNKNWKNLVKDYFSSKKDAGIKNILISAAIALLVQFFNANSADDLIKNVEIHQQQKTPDSVLVNKLEKLMPYPVSNIELSILQGISPDTTLFEKVLTKKVKDAIEHEVLPGIQKDSVFSSINKDKLEVLLFEAFKKKLSQPEHKVALDVLKDYLKKRKTDMKLVDRTIKNAIDKFLTVS